MKRLRLGAALHFLIAIGHIGCIYDFRCLQFISSLVPAIIAWCYWPGVKKEQRCVKVMLKSTFPLTRP